MGRLVDINDYGPWTEQPAKGRVEDMYNKDTHALWGTPGYGGQYLNPPYQHKPTYPVALSDTVAQYKALREKGATAAQAWGQIHTGSMDQRKYWYVWKVGGDAPRVKHTTRDSAVKEADRLSNTDKNATFVVLESIVEVGYVHTPYANILK